MIGYSPESNAAYIQLSDEPVTRTLPLEDARIVDYDARGRVVGVEFIGASSGLDLRHLPGRDRLEIEARVLNFPIFALAGQSVGAVLQFVTRPADTHSQPGTRESRR